MKIEPIIKEVINLLPYKLYFEYGILQSNLPTFILLSKKGAIEANKVYIFKDTLEFHDTYKNYRDDYPVGLASYKNYKIIHKTEISKKKNSSHFIIIKDDNDDIIIKTLFPNLTPYLFNIHSILEEWDNQDIEFKYNEKSKIISKLLKSKIPDEYKRVNEKIYRGLRLSPTAMKKLSQGKTITLRNRKVSSWSKYFDKAAEFAAENQHTHKKNSGLVMEYTPSNDVLIDINAFEVGIFKTTTKLPTGGTEAEVLIINSSKSLVVHPKQVKYINGLFYEYETLDWDEFKDRNQEDWDHDEYWKKESELYDRESEEQRQLKRDQSRVVLGPYS